ncbi:Translation initiation factor eIF-2B subunit beta [Smittium culicis]|uniref:Translation initiation factor eIF2B subunit beta n=1 Tax=Smittium culicis TaxID=133412 RepID=A0A1R1YSV5_9FUNG|nr:Translation initiation factor eIF-2B subunit beta [Smittium culicis]
MTCGHSKTVEMYLKSAARKRRFMVIITESAPSYKGHDLAKSLSGPNIEAIVIPDAAVFAMMSRVNKVILGTHTILNMAIYVFSIVMANGGLISDAGTQMIATAAKYHSIPVVVCAGLYKLSPIFPFDQDRFNTLESPDGIFPYKDEIVDQIDVLNPSCDYVGPELVDIIVDHLGGHLPSYVYRLLQENYNIQDIMLLKEQLI